ncbi:GNAT family N-acetyltransferase [Pseudogulbenkiania subflava]|uniref:Mig-14 protein n=1 Tax=Pseudogulbenkiania subflava DSM 22618 TaxID=1123014 RepID=A0A1Y6BG88_9NEIS|nr:GNAT family N-acetyltransferase [Pseudogulbenkiania subflava]SMF02252.1 Mig-14 protein [Pseudogulbenkiania subflava DSM 22618]
MTCLLRSLGWRSVSPEDYSLAYRKYGGSVINHPDILAFINRRFDCAPSYWGKPGSPGELSAVVATWGAYLAGEKEALKRFGIDTRFDFGTPEVVLPLAPDFRSSLLFRSKHLALDHQPQIANLSQRNRGRTLCFAKGLGENGMSKRSCQRRRNEAKKLLEAGGEIQPVSAFDPDQLATLYSHLFEKRWQRPYPLRPGLTDMMSSLRHLMTGHVILIKGQPVAFQFLLAAHSGNHYSVEYINGGVDPAAHEFSPGTVLTWLNVEQSWNLAQELGAQLRYSFGRNSADYKAQWAYEVPLLRTITL